MELYKLFCIIHRRTDFEYMYEIQREMMFPEEYAERRKRGAEALRRLNLMTSTVYGMLGDKANGYIDAYNSIFR